MGNYSSNNYTNPFIMIDVDLSGKDGSGDYSRFASDITDDPEKTVIIANAKNKVKDYTLARMFKEMVINYTGSKEIIKTGNDITSSKYIPSENYLPGGEYKDHNNKRI